MLVRVPRFGSRLDHINLPTPTACFKAADIYNGHSRSLDMCWSTGSWLGLLLGHSHTQICPSAPELEIRAGDDEDEDDDDDEDDEY